MQVEKKPPAAVSSADRLYAAAVQQHQAGRIGDAIALYGRVLAVNPGCIDVHVNLANALAAQGSLDDAIASYRRALAISPNHVDVLFNLGNVLMYQCQPDEAIASYARALAIEPSRIEVHVNLGNALAARGSLDDAIASYRRALAIRPDCAEAHLNLGRVLERQSKLNDAIASYQRALAVKPDFLQAHHILGLALCQSSRVEDGFATFMRHAELAYGRPMNVPYGNAPSVPHKVRHDQEQRDYLVGCRSDSDTKAIDIPFRLADGSRLARSAVNPVNAALASERWKMSRPQVVVIDNFLTDEALDKLRRFCWGSTVWRRTYDEGYLGAMPEYGFACPLLAQIAEELRYNFPTIFQAHSLQYLWAFKYDSQLAGIKVHADEAAVNVNFWVTPDEANLDPEHGGLIIWDVAAPPDWGAAKYNGDAEACRDFIARAGARPITIPYRSNRAVIFDSDLFHETDKFVFRDGYLNRRINVTLLYGKRSAADK